MREEKNRTAQCLSSRITKVMSSNSNWVWKSRKNNTDLALPQSITVITDSMLCFFFSFYRSLSRSFFFSNYIYGFSWFYTFLLFITILTFSFSILVIVSRISITKTNAWKSYFERNLIERNFLRISTCFHWNKKWEKKNLNEQKKKCSNIIYSRYGMEHKKGAEWSIYLKIK